MLPLKFLIKKGKETSKNIKSNKKLKFKTQTTPDFYIKLIVLARLLQTNIVFSHLTQITSCLFAISWKYTKAAMQRVSEK